MGNTFTFLFTSPEIFLSSQAETVPMICLLAPGPHIYFLCLQMWLPQRPPISRIPVFAFVWMPYFMHHHVLKVHLCTLSFQGWIISHCTVQALFQSFHSSTNEISVFPPFSYCTSSFYEHDMQISPRHLAFHPFWVYIPKWGSQMVWQF